MFRRDEENHLEWDTVGWQSFYTRADIEDLIRSVGFLTATIEPMVFDAPDEVDHTLQVYADSLRGVPRVRLHQAPLFEHLLVAER